MSDDQRIVLDGLRMLLPQLSEAEQREVLSGIARYQWYNGALRKIQMRCPRAKVAIARCVRLKVPREAAAILREHRPVLIALPHIGPAFFAFTVLLRALRHRPVYALHTSNTPFAQANADYLAWLGVTSIIPTDESLRNLVRTLRAEPNAVVIVAFDYLLTGKRRTVEMFGTRLAAAHGIAHLADATGAATLIACWHSPAYLPQVVISGPYEIDRSAPRQERQASLMSRLFAYVECEVRKHPHRWTQWASVVDSAGHARKLSR